MVSGSVTIMKDDIESVPVMLIENSYFGEYEIIESMNRLHTVKAFTDCDIYYLESLDFKKLFMEDMVFYQGFCVKARQRELEIARCNSEIDHFILRKTFWKQALRGKTSRKQKREFKKFVQDGKYSHRKQQNEKNYLKRAMMRGNTFFDLENETC